MGNGNNGVAKHGFLVRAVHADLFHGILQAKNEAEDVFKFPAKILIGRLNVIGIALQLDQKLDILTGLGNGYDLSCAGEYPVLLGGGVGVPPMYNLAKKLISMGKQVSVILGFNTASEIFYEEDFKALGCCVTVTTVDGSYGVKGFVTDALPEKYTHFYTCGPEPMLKAVYKATNTSGQMSFEERMGCGFGACMGCSCKTLTGYKRICKDGPVMRKEEIAWNA